MRRRIWCETVSPDELGAGATVGLLRRFDVAPILAVWPETAPASRALAARFEGEGLPVAIWPMLPDAAGRWINAANAGAFGAFVERLAGELGPREIVLDLEPAIDQVRSTLASSAVSAHVLPAGPDAAAFSAARVEIGALVGRLRERGIAVSAAVAPPVLLGSSWQERLGTPVDGLGFSHVSVMLYTSMIEGWSRGALRRADARAILGKSCSEAVSRFGARAGASLGAVGTGAFGDEPTYRGVAELADDVAIARAAGLDDLALFDLGGVLRRPPAEAWLEAFVATPPAARLPEPTLRSRAAIAGAVIAGGVFGALGRARDAISPRRRGPA
jgi:hypothetical protein